MAQSTPARPARLACLECRRKHVKCDGVTPVCGRCVTESQSCNWQRSQRGLTKRKHGKTVEISRPPATSSTQTANVSFDAPSTISRTSLPSPESIGMSRSSTASISSLNEHDRSRFMFLFYSKFYPAHPMLVPQTSYDAQRYPGYMDQVVCFIGQHYSITSDALLSQNAIFSILSERTDVDTVHRVQALILFSIILHARHSTREAELCIARAGRIALRIGLNMPEFASINSSSNPQVEESLRRTWWELYTIDAYTAALHRRTSFTTMGCQTHPYLPRRQSAYESMAECNPVSLQTFDSRVFAPDNALTLSFSSNCYRVEAIRIVERVLSLAARENVQADDVQSVDNAIASWKYHLPSCGADVVDPSGELDHMLFQAHCMVHCASIFLHFPRSDLPPTVPSAAEITCGGGYTQLAPLSAHHTIKAIAASKQISNLAAIPFDPQLHSPYFSCALVLGCIVQLAAASIHLHTCGTQCLQQHRDRVVLMLGVLRRLSKTWGMAQNAVTQIRIVANTVFSLNVRCESSSNSTSAVDDNTLDPIEFPSNASWFDLLSPNELHNDLLSFT